MSVLEHVGLWVWLMKCVCARHF